MEHEKVLVMDDDSVTRELIVEFIESEDSHTVVAQASSNIEAERLIKEGVKPTVAILDNSCGGEGVANIIRWKSPKTVIVSYSAADNLTWGDQNWSKKEGLAKLPQKLTELQH